MSEKHLHIITHNVPWPADFGGIVDLFYKLKTLSGLGVKIHLHCFTQGRPPQEELKKYCASVNYYERRNNISGLSFSIPYIVNSRKCEEMLENLQKDTYPVLLEGIHCTYYLHSGMLDNRKVIIRLHNAEFEYYRNLARHEHNFLKRFYFIAESLLLKKYEKKLCEKTLIAAVSNTDVKLYRKTFETKNIHYLPVFLPYNEVSGKEGKGCFCLYHGNLSINENEKAASWLLENVFNDLSIPFVIAGKNPSQRLETMALDHHNACLVANPSDTELHDLVSKAQINILPSFNNTGVKLKLLNALFNGRHCLVNKAGVDGSGLESSCHIFNNAAEFKSGITRLYEQPFEEEEATKRQHLLKRLYDNEANAKQLMTWLY